MIVIVYPPGAYGTTVEAVLRSLTVELNDETVDLVPTKTGSMHGIRRSHRVVSTLESLSSLDTNAEIVEIHYPTPEVTDSILVDALERLSPKSTIVLSPSDINTAELALLNVQHKLEGSVSGVIMVGAECHITRWGHSYESLSDMQHWELRELLSQYYSGVISGWMSQAPLAVNTINVTMTEMLHETVSALKRIISFTGFTLSDEDRLRAFAEKWKKAQQYIIDEHALALNIVDRVIAGDTGFTWDTCKLSLISEAIIQKRLRDAGYEIRCFGLDEFPNNTETLVSLLENAV